MIRLAQERSSLTVINDQFGAPTGAELLADVTAHALRSSLKTPELAGLYVTASGETTYDNKPRFHLPQFGLYHVTASGETTWYDYARFVLNHAQQLGVPLKANAEQVTPVPTSTFPTPAKRPHNSRLDCRRFCHAFDLTLPHWQLGVTRMLTETL